MEVGRWSLLQAFGQQAGRRADAGCAIWNG